MIRTFAHRSVDLVFDLCAELLAAIADLGPLAAQWAKRARARWQDRRSMPGWDSIDVLDAATPTPDPTVTILVAQTDERPSEEDQAVEQPGFLASVLRDDRDLVAVR